jgi:hypothetical protein
MIRFGMGDGSIGCFGIAGDRLGVAMQKDKAMNSFM